MDQNRVVSDTGNPGRQELAAKESLVHLEVYETGLQS